MAQAQHDPRDLLAPSPPVFESIDYERKKVLATKGSSCSSTVSYYSFEHGLRRRLSSMFQPLQRSRSVRVDFRPTCGRVSASPSRCRTTPFASSCAPTTSATTDPACRRRSKMARRKRKQRKKTAIRGAIRPTRVPATASMPGDECAQCIMTRACMHLPP